jgi:hypothetical protein
VISAVLAVWNACFSVVSTCMICNLISLFFSFPILCLIWYCKVDGQGRQGTEHMS